MRDILPDLEHVTPEWLTEMLQDQGHLQDGRVVAVHLKKMWPTAVSLVAHLEVQYTNDTSAALPSQLFLKTSWSDLITNFPLRGQKEVAFYPRITAAMPAPQTLICRENCAMHLVQAGLRHYHLQQINRTLKKVCYKDR
jgi:hypothetical protein